MVSSNVTISKNIIYGVGVNRCLWLDGSCIGNRISDNIVYEAFRGIECGGRNHTIDNNTIYSIAEIGVTVNSQNTIITNNSIYGCELSGLRGTADHMVIENNDVVNNTLCGLEIIGIDYANISDNMLSDNGVQGGLYIWGGIKNNVFNNTIYSNICGINITSSNDFSINANWIFSNDENVGIKIVNCLDENIYNNYFDNSFL